MFLVIVDAIRLRLPAVSAGWVEAVDVETGRSRVVSRGQLRRHGREVRGWQDEVGRRAGDAGLDVLRLDLDDTQSDIALTEFAVERRLRKNDDRDGSRRPRADGRWLTPPLAARRSGPTPRRRSVDADPVRCWWRADRGAIRMGEPFKAVLTCAVLETASAKVVVDRSRLDSTVMALPPFDVLGGAAPRTPRHRVPPLLPGTPTCCGS